MGRVLVRFLCLATALAFCSRIGSFPVSSLAELLEQRLG
jgi:hypothetical protein